MNLISILKGKVLRDTGLYAFSSVINAAIPFFLLPVLTRFLSPRDYGIVAMFQALLGILVVFAGLNMHGAVTRQYFDRDEIDFPQYVGNCILILFLSSTFFGALIFVFSGMVEKYSGFPASWLWAVLLVAFGQGLTQIVLVLWQVKREPVRYGVYQILLTATVLSLSLLLIVGLGMDWTGRVLAQLVAVAFFSLAGFSLMWQRGDINFNLNATYIKSALKFGVPLVPHAFGGWAISMSDRLLLTNMIGIAEAGIYVVGAQVGMVIGLLQDSFNRAWVPWFFEKLKDKSEEMDIKIVKTTYVYDAFLLASACVLAAVTPWLFSFLVGEEFQEAGIYVFWIAVGYAFNGMYKMVANYIFFENKNHILAGVTFITATINVVFSYILISLNGAIGAAQGTMMAFFVSLVLVWFCANKIHPMPWGLQAFRRTK